MLSIKLWVADAQFTLAVYCAARCSRRDVAEDLLPRPHWWSWPFELLAPGLMSRSRAAASSLTPCLRPQASVGHLQRALLLQALMWLCRCCTAGAEGGVRDRGPAFAAHP